MRQEQAKRKRVEILCRIKIQDSIIKKNTKKVEKKRLTETYWTITHGSSSLFLSDNQSQILQFTVTRGKEKHQILCCKNYCTVVYPANRFISAFCSPFFAFIVVVFENDTGAVTYSTLVHLLQ